MNTRTKAETCVFPSRLHDFSNSSDLFFIFMVEDIFPSDAQGNIEARRAVGPSASAVSPPSVPSTTPLGFTWEHALIIYLLHWGAMPVQGCFKCNENTGPLLFPLVNGSIASCFLKLAMDLTAPPFKPVGTTMLQTQCGCQLCKWLDLRLGPESTPASWLEC